MYKYISKVPLEFVKSNRTISYRYNDTILAEDISYMLLHYSGRIQKVQAGVAYAQPRSEEYQPSTLYPSDASVVSYRHERWPSASDVKTVLDRLGDEFHGITGPQGALGTTGPTGDRGFQGERGLVGPLGKTGPTGPQGLPGIIGPLGPQGLPGIRGFQGYQGFQGFQGNLGVTGPTGYQGIRGYQGFLGATGPTGHQGFQGFQGNQGYLGSTGPTGSVPPTQVLATAGEYLPQYSVVCISPIDFKFYLATNVLSEIQATAAGIVLASNGIAQDQTGLIQIGPGVVTNENWSLTSYTTVFLGINGGITTEQTESGWIKPIGYALSSTSIFFDTIGYISSYQDIEIEIIPDLLDIDYVPLNYIPTITPRTTTTLQLGSHLAGIDAILGTLIP